MIYQHIEGSGSAGTWKRTLVLKTNLHENTITRSLKELVAKGLVREIKSAKYPTRRIYLLAHIKPSADNLGGTFFDGGVLDEGMVHEVKKVAFFTIEQASWAKKEIPQPPIDVTAKPGRKHRPKYRYIPHPPDYAQYPTPLDVLNNILKSGILKPGVSFVEDDIIQLLKNLEYDGQIERMRNPLDPSKLAYRSVRRGTLQGTKPSTVGFEHGLLGINEKDIGTGEGPGNGFTSIPCGRCEVFQRCRPGGVVSPEGCRYMAEWLQW
jgi:DNA-directed RNA polymerase III subunit RPC6